MTNQPPSYQDVIDLLHERGVTEAGTVVSPDEDLEAVRGAIALWDKRPDGTPGLLVYMIRNGQGHGYKPAHQRTPVHSSESSEFGRSADEWYTILRSKLHRPGTYSGDPKMASTHEFDDDEVWEMARLRAAG